MNIADMHIWFRQYAQQMGMQNTRGILPEQIDITLNSAISDYVNQVIGEHIALTNDRTTTSNSKVGQINALRTLYKFATLNFGEAKDAAQGLFSFDNIETSISNKVLYFSDFKMNYTKNGKDTTRYYDVRLIDHIRLGSTLSDYILRPKVTSPIAVYYNDTLDVYLGEEYQHGNRQLKKTTLEPYHLGIGYIKVPNKVKLSSDGNNANIDCDLPEYCHVDIIKHAVDLYNTALRGNLYNSQQQAQRTDAQRAQQARSAANSDN